MTKRRIPASKIFQQNFDKETLSDYLKRIDIEVSVITKINLLNGKYKQVQVNVLEPSGKHYTFEDYYDYNEGESNWNSIQERIYNIMRGTAFTCDIDDNADDFNDNADDNCKWYNRHFISNLQIISEGQSNYEETYYIGKPLAYKNNKNNNFISFEL